MRQFLFYNGPFIVMTINFFIALLLWMRSDYHREEDQKEAKARENVLTLENERLQREVETLSYDPLRVQRGHIFQYLRDFKEPI